MAWRWGGDQYIAFLINKMLGCKERHIEMPLTINKSHKYLPFPLGLSNYFRSIQLFPFCLSNYFLSSGQLFPYYFCSIWLGCILLYWMNYDLGARLESVRGNYDIARKLITRVLLVGGGRMDGSGR